MTDKIQEELEKDCTFKVLFKEDCPCFKEGIEDGKKATKQAMIKVIDERIKIYKSAINIYDYKLAGAKEMDKGILKELEKLKQKLGELKT